MKYFFEDKNIEEAMIKSCLLFNNKNIKGTRSNLFQKLILSLVISGRKNKNSIKSYLEDNHKNYLFDDSKIDSAIIELNKNGLVNINEEEITLSSQIQDEANGEINKIVNQLDSLINEIFEQVQKDYSKPINNSEQVKLNIKECINYYYAVSGFSFFELDNRKDVEELGKLEEIASRGLNSDDKTILSNLIIYAVGYIINNPKDKQRAILEYLARIYITTQIMGIDPLLNNFKSTIISKKEFILDTDVVLFAMTENALYSEQYRMMIQQLISCGCKVYLPEEVVVEIFNHAEAAKARYHFVSNLMDNNEDWVRNELKNIFIEDYYTTKRITPEKYPNWDTYIGNYYSFQYGKSLIYAQIKERLGDKIIYGQMPAYYENNETEYVQLSEATLEETWKTEKASHRDDGKNREIAQTDTKLYLTIKRLNRVNNDKIGMTSERPYLLVDKYYILTNSVRVHYCAKKLGIDANVLCKPFALMAYLAETGIMSKSTLRITSLFDNPFLLHTSRIVWDDVKTLIDKGVNLKGKNIVKLQYDLQAEIQDLFAVETDDEYMGIYDRVIHKGYEFEPYVKNIIEESKEKSNKIELLEKQLKESQEQLCRANKKLALEKYEIRSGKKKVIKARGKKR